MTDNETNYYHVFNRGVEKRDIFLDTQDYGVFLKYLKEYLSGKDEKQIREILVQPLDRKERDKIWKSIYLKNYCQEMDLLAYCLMPNHFHFFIKAKITNTIDRFMHSLCTRYVKYFNAKYKRVGPLFQGRYKSVLITDEGQFMHISRYIHKQALVLQGTALQQIQPSSYLEYIGERNTQWVHPEAILDLFEGTSGNNSYQEYVIEAMRSPASHGDEGEI